MSEKTTRTTQQKVLAGGGVLWRSNDGQLEVALIHRPKYDDWSFPKGKFKKSDKSVKQCALREVREETGFEVSIDRELGSTQYRTTGKNDAEAVKIVDYWLMQAGPGKFVPTKEVDELHWLGPQIAKGRLSYQFDKELLTTAVQVIKTKSLRDSAKHEATLGTVSSGGKREGTAQLTHLALAVRNMNDSIEFYERYTGLKTIHSRTDGETRVAWLGDPKEPYQNFVLVLAQGPEVARPIGPFAHLGFAVESRDDVDAMAKRAADEGILALAPIEGGPIVGYLCEVRDPDGNLCEFSYGQALGRS